ncbi:cytochrome c oxidase assembly factor 3 homolog, mitochondrial [Paroedura picta]|uniref:cytochrome c oxidase assembly factor 3 homolog, mitochondrial n=1 Tax=Paroedura picta TaxID=143630 RepID=UPI004055F1E5
MSGKMSAPAQGGGGGGDGGVSREAERYARQRWEAARAGAPLRPVYVELTRGLKIRNALTGLAIGAVALGIYSYTFYSISQEHFLDDLELEAKAVQAQTTNTSAN